MGSEKQYVENPIKKYLELRRLNGDRVFHFKIHQTSANIKGISDILCVINGLIIAIETKAKGEVATDAQKIFGKNIMEAGGVFVIVDDYKSFVTWYEDFYFDRIGTIASFYNLTGNARNDL